MIFKNAKIVDCNGARVASIRIENGMIAQVESDFSKISQSCKHEIIELDSEILMPSLIDLNVYPKSRTLSKKNLNTLAQKALLGGFSDLLIMPDTNPALDSESIIELVKSVNSENQTINIHPTIMPTKDAGLSDINRLYSSGAKCIFLHSDINTNLIVKVAQYAQMLNLPIICFAQNKDLSNGVLNAGNFAFDLGLPTISEHCQNIEILKICEILQNSGVQVVFSAVSSLRGLEIIENYKKRGLKASAEVSLHHLILNECVCENYNTAGKINPPLLSETGRLELVQALQNGAIDLLTSLQCADFNSQKDQVFELASFGIDSIAQGFSLAYDGIFSSNLQNLNLRNLSKMFSKNPAQILGLNKGQISQGLEADFIIIDLDSQNLVIDIFSPYNEKSLRSKVKAIFRNGSFQNLNTESSKKKNNV